MQNILLINHYAGSNRLGMEYRPFYLAREWAAHGHSVTVLAANYSHLRTSQPVVGADLETTEEEGVRFRWLRANKYAGNGVGRVSNMLAFIGKLFAYADRIGREEHPDVVICSSTYPLDIYPGAKIARSAGAQLVFEVHDLWPLTPVLLGGYSPTHPYIRCLRRAEEWAYRNAERVISILPNTREYMVSRGLDPRKFAHVPNGVPVSQVLSAQNDLPGAAKVRVAQERKRGRFLVGYAGGINLAMALGTLLEAASILGSDEVSFFLAGDGPEAGNLRAQLARSNLDNFHLLGHIPKLSILNFLSTMDVLAIPWHRSPLYAFGVSPNKIFDYMLAGRPIVQACDASNDLVAEAKCGLTVPPENPRALADAVRHLQRLPVIERQRLGENGRQFVCQHHDYRNLASHFLAALAQQHPCSVPIIE